MTFVLANKIAKAYKEHGFVEAIIYGRRGSGKSSYAIQVLRDFFMSKGLSENEAYDEAIRVMKYRMGDIIEFVKTHADNGDIAPSLIIDDAGVGLSRYRWWTEPKQILHLQSMMDTVRSGLSSILMTCPSPKSILSFIRKDYDDYFVKITKVSGDWRRKAIGYQMSTLPSGKTYVFKKFEDNYSCYLPNKVYQKYDKIRRGYLKEAMAKLEKMTQAPTSEMLGD